MSQLPTIITTGASGMVGSRVIEVLQNHFHFTNLDIRSVPSVDITNPSAVISALTASTATWVIHFAAFTDVTKAHEENGDTSGLTYKINVEGTSAVVKACEATGKKLIHISTAYVFDGNKQTPYTEEDAPKPIEWYGATKAMAEEVVLGSEIQATILRIDNPFRATPFSKPDIVARICSKLKDGTLPPQFTDSHFGPTVIEDTARIIKWAIEADASGIYHATNNESWSPYDFAKEIAKKMGLSKSVKAGSLQQFLLTTPRPYQANTALDCSKLLKDSSLTLSSVSEAVDRVTYLSTHSTGQRA